MQVLTNSHSPVLISNAELWSMMERKLTKRRARDAATHEKQILEEKEKRRRPKQETSKFQHRDWIEESVYAYLQTTPCTTVPIDKLPALRSQLMSTKKQKQRRGLNNNNSNSNSNNNSNNNDDDDGGGGNGKKSATVSTGFGLTVAEATQIVNFMPTEPVEIHALVEDLHARMSEARQEQLLELIASYRIDHDGNDADDDAADDDDDDTDTDAIARTADGAPNTATDGDDGTTPEEVDTALGDLLPFDGNLETPLSVIKEEL